MSSGRFVLTAVGGADSSTECELVGLITACSLQAVQIITDSLAPLQLIKQWASYSTRRQLSVPTRALVRQFIRTANQLQPVPLLEKVKAHDEVGMAMQLPKTRQ